MNGQPLLKTGQRTTRPVLDNYVLEDQDGQPINLSAATEVTLTTQHHATGLIETDAQPVEITDANAGEIRYQFGPEEIPLDGRYDAQFLITFDNGDTQAVPPGTDWFPFISVARKLPGEKMAARFSSLRVDELTAASFSADEFTPDVITGPIAGGETITRLDGPNISINEHGELAVGTTDGSTDLVDHDHSETGAGGDTLRPLQIGSTSSRVGEGHFDVLTANAPDSATGVTRREDLNSHAGATGGVHGVEGSSVAATSDITEHANATSGVHGVGDSDVASVADLQNLDTGGQQTATLVTANYTASNYDRVLADASGGELTVTLPPVADDLDVVIKKIDSSANTVTIATPGSETIDGEPELSITNQYTSRPITASEERGNYFII